MRVAHDRAGPSRQSSPHPCTARVRHPRQILRGGRSRTCCVVVHFAALIKCIGGYAARRRKFAWRWGRFRGSMYCNTNYINDIHCARSFVLAVILEGLCR